MSNKIWIDLDNSPHVPFFKPIVRRLRQQGYEVMLTARDCFQVRELAALHGVGCTLVGKHYGKHRLLKIAGLMMRALQLAPGAVHQRPQLALSHGSRAQMLVAGLLGIPAALILDYEHVAMLPFIQPAWVIAPEHVSDLSLKKYAHAAIKYPGIKEEVYVSDLEPDDRILTNWGIHDGEIVATIRPPATEAHYHNEKSEMLFVAAMNFIIQHPDTRMILLPRNEKQLTWIKKRWPVSCRNGKITIPDQVVDGLNLIWHSDLVLSGGGTINREAAALGVPAYSIFCGTLGGVDRYLMETGRLLFLRNLTDVHTKLLLARRARRPRSIHAKGDALQHIVAAVMAMLEHTEISKSNSLHACDTCHEYPHALPRHDRQ